MNGNNQIELTNDLVDCEFAENLRLAINRSTELRALVRRSETEGAIAYSVPHVEVHLKNTLREIFNIVYHSIQFFSSNYITGD